jgi:dTDP-4-amino-4,6-dideoxygalactose transaminase
LRAAFDRVLERSWFVLGAEVEGFERRFAEYCGTGDAVGVASGMDALTIALAACGIGAGDEVVTVAHTVAADALAIARVGARPVFVDVDPVTYTMDPDAAAAAITRRTRAILPVHLYGQTADMEPLLGLAREHGLRLIEDAAQAHGARYDGRVAGSFGDVGCYSFYPSKNLGALGDAGALVTSDPEIADRARELRNYGQRDRYHHAVRGYNSRLDELQAALLSVKLDALEDWNARRRHAAGVYMRELDDRFPKPVEGQRRTHVYHLFVIRSDARDELRRHLAEAGVQTEVHYPIPAHQQQCWDGVDIRTLGLTQTEHLAGEVVSLPLFPSITNAQLAQVVEAVNSF